MSITVEELNKMIENIADLRAKESEASMAKKVISDELALAEGRVIDALTELNMESYKSPHGGISISHRSSVKLPQGEDRQRFFNYLKQKGLYDTMIGVNSQTLNSFYKSELKAAQDRGDADFNVPGINEVTLTPVLSFRRN